MAKEQVTVKKSYIKYYASIKQEADVTTDVTDEETGEITQDTARVEYTSFYKFETKDEDYSPFVEYDETVWEQVENLPEDEALWQIKVVKVPFIDEETQEESIIEYTYYYAYYEVEETVDKYIKGICTACLYCVQTNRFYFNPRMDFEHRHRKYECANPEHIVKNYVTGATRNGDCRDFNANGECRLFTLLTEDEIPEDENNENPEENTPDVPSEDVTPDVPGDTGDDTLDDTESSDDTQEGLGD